MAQATLLRYLAPRTSADAGPPQDGCLLPQTLKEDDEIQDVKLSNINHQRTGVSAVTQRESYNSTSTPSTQQHAEYKDASGLCIARVESAHLIAIKKLTSTTLPMRYTDKFFQDVIVDSQAADLARVALCDGKPVGWIRCCLEQVSPSDPYQAQIYIQALCLLAPHRQRGLATQLLQVVTEADVILRYGITSIYAHVWESNEDALEWYQHRGFKQVLLVDQYYRRLRPGGAWVLRKDLG